MHEIYKMTWNVANKTSKILPFTNRTWCLFFSTLLWLLIGVVVSAVILTAMLVFDSSINFPKWMIVISSYSAAIFGFAGATMYILRNTNSEDLL